jgi:phosphoribosylformylglycinamidine cyclo-ligase
MTASPGLREAYTGAGVNVEAGERAVELLKGRVGTGDGLDLLTGIGAFASAVALPGGYREPVLVSATDGVGTKTAIAAALGRYETIGRDLVAMCADDVVCLGGRPLLFLDYVAVGRLEPLTVANLVAGIAEACEVAGCTLVGGETAEHPGVMDAEQFDVAGFCLGIAEREELLDGSHARTGDVLIGLESSGLHANGYSLVRAVIARDEIALDAKYADVVRDVAGAPDADRVQREEPEVAAQTLGEVLLTPTRIYAADVLELRARLRTAGHDLHGLAHITGGGLPGNLPRAIPESLAARIETGSWPVRSVFRLLAALAGLDGPQLRATFNAGLGMVAVVPADAATLALEFLAERDIRAWTVGDVVPVEETDGARYVERDSRHDASANETHA